ncbi:o-acyltransferase (wsd1-like) family protein [Holotrichia oblita]|uniref:O-acyltransferase (Wsd1-like) family protein n=1 Tax=Holotrichia oblita TaxID=644536 RepID=A0ACB9SPU0_HOLOL|nr:o-acyltransferase (wsd1-like) family protein [Holotrichia oblita]
MVETHRNQGILTMLLKINGPPTLASIRRHLEELVRRKDRNGKLAFPHLTDCLVTRCGTYAWRKNAFDLEQNLIFAPYNFRGRPVNELTIQDYVSDIVSKLLPSSIPPWQVVIIPSSENHHYLLLRLHHILLSEGLNIADMLPLIPPVKTNISNSDCKTSLCNVLMMPQYIPALKDRLTQDLTNSWNEFISNNDPLEKPELFKRSANFFEFLAISFIVSVSGFKEWRKGLKSIKPGIFSKVEYLVVTLKRERKKRQINFNNFIKSIFVSCDPRFVIAMLIKNWYRWSLFTLTIPHKIYIELKAIQTCITLKYCAYPNTIVGFLYSYVPLTFKALQELFNYCRVIFNTPRALWEELSRNTEKIETVTLCGRKVVAWSEPVKIGSIRKIADNTATSATEIILATASEALSRFVVHTNNVQPKEIPITARNINSNYFLLTGSNVRATDSVGGMLCINLPILDSRKDADLLENLKDIKDNIITAKQKQQLTFLLSILQTKYGFLSKLLPATLITIGLKYLSLKYSVSFTEITSRQPFVMQKTIWGQEVSSVIYWRPPQANISMSLCTNYYGQYVIFGVMCDAQLAPNHHLLVRGFHEHVKDLEASSAMQ